MWSYFIASLNPQLAEPIAASIYAVVFLGVSVFMALLGKMFYQGALEERSRRPEHMATVAKVNAYYGAHTLRPSPNFSGLTLGLAYGFFAVAALVCGMAVLAVLGPILL